MVSQKFMDILYQQPDYTNPSTSSSSSTENSDEQNPLQMMKKENDDNLMEAPSTSNNFIIDSGMLEPLTIIKEENEDVKKKGKKDTIIKEEMENNSDDLHQFLVESIESDVNNQVLPSDEAPKGDLKRNFSNPCASSPYFIKDREDLRPPSKRIRKGKIIFDPSDVSDKVQSKKIPGEIKDMSRISGTSKSCTNNPNEDTMSKPKEQRDGDLQCEYCGKYMQRIDYLRLHLMKHTGETPYKCPHCQNAYRARWRLNQHVRTHTKNLPYHCPYCCYRGNRSDYLTSHINRIHKNLRNDSEKVTKNAITNDNVKSEVNTIKEENVSESEVDTMIKEEFPSYFANEQYTSNS